MGTKEDDVVRRLPLWLLLVSALLLPACGMLARPQADFKTTERGFVHALRWGDYRDASRFLEPAWAEKFRARFAALKDLRITRVDAESEPLADRPQRMTTRLEVDYYRLPSLTVRTRILNLEWEYRGEDRWHPGQWRLVGAFPPFP